MSLPETCENRDTNTPRLASGRLYTNSDELPNNKHRRAGRLYVIEKVSGLIKVGIAMNARKRAMELECANGERFRQFWVSPMCFNFAAVEANLHDRMKRYRAIGEWFNVPFAVVVGMARQCSYDRLSRYAEVRALAAAAAMIKPPP